MDPIAVKSTIKSILLVAGALAVLTPNQVDDQIVATLKILADNDILIELLSKILNSVHINTGHKVTEQDLVAVVKNVLKIS
jgi:hypothetical protein